MRIASGGRRQGLAPRLIVTGGGGYNPYTVARCWAGIWATLNGFPIPAPAGGAGRRCFGASPTTARRGATRRALVHHPCRPAREGLVRDSVLALAERALEDARMTPRRPRSPFSPARALAGSAAARADRSAARTAEGEDDCRHP
jgi:hypothetical protein